jgi:hypothetical protein
LKEGRGWLPDVVVVTMRTRQLCSRWTLRLSGVGPDEETRMNRYGSMAQSHWSRFLPTRYAQIEDPTTFFTRLGLEVEDAVTTQSALIADDDPAGEGYLDKLGRLRMARLQAEETVLAEKVLLPAEPGSAMDEDLEPDETTSATEDWIPLHEDPSHPFWRAQTEP